MNSKRALVAFLLLSLTGCTLNNFGIKADSADKLRERVVRCWNEKLKGNWEGFQKCACERWLSKRGSQGLQPKMKITSFQVVQIEMGSEQEAFVTVSFDLEAMGYTFKGATVRERWVLEKSNWSFCPEETVTPFGPLKDRGQGEVKP